MPNQEHDVKFYALIHQIESLSDEDITEMLGLLSKTTPNMVRPHVIGMLHNRVGLEQIISIRCFNKASGLLVEETNKLTNRLFLLTVVTIVLATVSVVVAAWPYIVWWVSHGFRFH